MPSTQLPSTLYTGGNVVLNSQPYTQYYLNREAQERAKEDALDRYFRDVDTKINPAGMRTQEIPKLLEQQKSNKEYYLKNRKAILNPTTDSGAALNEYYARNAAMNSWINRSKGLAEKYKPFASAMADPTKRQLMTKAMVDKVGRFDLTMDDPNWVDLNTSDFDFNPKPFEIKNYSDQLKPDNETLVTSYEKVKEVDPKNPQFKVKEIVTATPSYNDGKLASVAETAYENDPSFRGLINKIEQNPSLYNKYNDIYKKAFGKDLDIQHPEQIGVALFLEQKKPSYEKSNKETVDTNAQWAWRNKITSQQALDRAYIMANFRDNLTDKYSSEKHIEGIKESGTPMTVPLNIGGKSVQGVEVNIPPELEGEFFDKTNGRVRRPDKVVMDDQNIYLVNFKEGGIPTKFDSKGQPIFTGNETKVVNQDKTRTIPISSSFRASLEKNYGNSKKNLYPTGQSTTAPSKTQYKYSASGGNGKIFSNDGKTWYDQNGKKIQ